MYHLATVFPPVRGIRIPFTRDQMMLLMAAVNEIFLGVDTYLAHSISGTIRPYEWIPIIFGPAAGALLLAAGLVALRRRSLANVVASVVLLSSIGVGLLGAYFHLVRTILPSAPAGQRVSIDLFVWAPPLLGPLTFAMVGLLGISAAWVEDPPDSGALKLLGNWQMRLPYSRTRAYFLIIGLGILATVISSVLDHARTHFQNPWLWLPTAAGIFATTVTVAMGALGKPTRGDLLVFVGAMLLLIAVGLIGTVLHVTIDLAGENELVVERFIRGAPFLAPLLFANMGALGLIVLLDPRERGE